MRASLGRWNLRKLLIKHGEKFDERYSSGLIIEPINRFGIFSRSLPWVESRIPRFQPRLGLLNRYAVLNMRKYLYRHIKNIAHRIDILEIEQFIANKRLRMVGVPAVPTPCVRT